MSETIYSTTDKSITNVNKKYTWVCRSFLFSPSSSHVHILPINNLFDIPCVLGFPCIDKIKRRFLFLEKQRVHITKKTNIK